MNKTKTYYQPFLRWNGESGCACNRKDDERWELPDELMSFHAFATKGDAEAFVANMSYSNYELKIEEYHDDDIEDVTILNEYGEVVEVNETGENTAGDRKSAELSDRLRRLVSDVDRAVESLLRQHMGQEVSFYRACENGFGNIPCFVARAGFSSEFENMSVDEVCFGVNDKGKFFVTLDASGNYGYCSVPLSNLDAGDRISVLDALEDFFEQYPEGLPEEDED